jgi:8-oxo-dGTP diphosphatase
VTEVRAAGGVVVRGAAGAAHETLLVHRPAYDDWTLPKGKAEPGEDDAACALREVEEETALRCLLGEELTTVRYRDRRGRDKQVRYWLMRPDPAAAAAGAGFIPGDEIDAVRWLPFDDAATLLTYPLDRDVLASAAEALAAEAPAAP